MCSAKWDTVCDTCFVVILGHLFTQKYKINGKRSNKISVVLQVWKGYAERFRSLSPDIDSRLVWSSMCGVWFSMSVVEEMSFVHMTLQKTSCSRLLPLSSSVPACGPILSPLLRPLLSLTSLCPYNSLPSCKGNKIDAGSR